MLLIVNAQAQLLNDGRKSESSCRCRKKIANKAEFVEFWPTWSKFLLSKGVESCAIITHFERKSAHNTTQKFCANSDEVRREEVLQRRYTVTRRRQLFEHCEEVRPPVIGFDRCSETIFQQGGRGVKVKYEILLCNMIHWFSPTLWNRADC